MKADIQFSKIEKKVFLLFAFIIAVSFNVHAANQDSLDSIVGPIISSYRLSANQIPGARPVTSRFQPAPLIPGVAIGITYNGNDYFYSYGSANVATNTSVTQDTIFELGSLTKVFTATLLEIAIGQGKMNLNDSVAKYVTALAGKPIAAVTLKQLADYTSGLPNWPPDVTLEKLIAGTYTKQNLFDYFAQWVPNKPGASYLYSDIGFGLLGYALEAAFGQPYAQLVSTYITGPLKMTNTWLEVPQSALSNYAQGYKKTNQIVAAPHWPASPWFAAGDLRSTITDMLAFVKANVGVLQPSQELTTAMTATHNPEFTGQQKSDLGWFSTTSNGYNVLTKDGATVGFSTALALIPNKKIGIAFLTNLGNAAPTKTATEIATKLASLP